ncbi:MAG: HAMP domain-containing sensor histidine kinase [Candidatus Nanopelagicales bacterium]
MTGLSLAVLFVGTVVPHLLAVPPSPEDAVSTGWLLTATAVAAVTAVVLAWAMARRITRPFDDYIDTAQRFAAGDHSVRPSGPTPPELADLAQALTVAADEIDRSEQARRQLTAEIAHELRTPLTVLQATLEELRDGHVAADHAILASLHDQVRRLSRVVHDLSELAAAESPDLQLELRDVDLARIAERAVRAYQGALDAAGLEVVRDFSPGVIVHADPDRVQQVAGNLLANAAGYCRRGDRVTVRVSPYQGAGRLDICDTGPGFRPEEVPHAFDRAWRGSSADGTRGSGLGLPIVRALVLAQGGQRRPGLSTGPGCVRVGAAAPGVDGGSRAVRPRSVARGDCAASRASLTVGAGTEAYGAPDEPRGHLVATGPSRGRVGRGRRARRAQLRRGLDVRPDGARVRRRAVRGAGRDLGP